MRALLFLVICLTATIVRAAPTANKIRGPLPGYGALLSDNYAGYIPVGPKGRQLFYWFVESENAPSEDPLVLWLNGGPGCSSLLGLLEENGPYVMRHGGQFVKNEFRWSTNASILYLESPAGVGFSEDTNPPVTWNDDKTAVATYAFLNSWLEQFPEFAHQPFFIGGESYAGHYVPQLAAQVQNGSNRALFNRMKGFFVGNPCTGSIGCGNFDPTLDVMLRYNGFRPLNAAVPMSAANYDHYDLLVPTCDNDQQFKRAQFSHPMGRAYAKRKAATFGNAPAPYGPCADDYVTQWLNRPDVQAAIHANTSITWVECSNALDYTINLAGVVALYHHFFETVPSWHIMIYSGLSDSVVNFVQTETIVNQFNRTLLVNEYQAWNLPDYYNSSATQLGGFYLEFDRLSWAGVRDAGHMVPQFNPPAGKELFTSFITTGKPGRM